MLLGRVRMTIIRWKVVGKNVCRSSGLPAVTLVCTCTCRQQSAIKIRDYMPDAVSINGKKRKRLHDLIKENFQDFRESPVDICPHCTRLECQKIQSECTKVHYQPILRPHTEPALGDCSYLNTCHRPDLCRYVHYELEDPGPREQVEKEYKARQQRKKELGHFLPRENGMTLALGLGSSQDVAKEWIECDVRNINPKALGNFDVILADPPWDIHQSLPYGTLSDDEMKSLPIAQLQSPGGLLFLWVTGRAMEVGRDCLSAWGYKRIDEIVWIKTSQLQRLIRTGRTGHWLNHSKEHCLVAYKLGTLPASQNAESLLSWANKGIDTNVIVSQVRETSRKPDELYEIIERIAPGKRRKLEIFGRLHNTRPGWLTIGNQLDGKSQVSEESRLRWNMYNPQRPL